MNSEGVDRWESPLKNRTNLIFGLGAGAGYLWYVSFVEDAEALSALWSGKFRSVVYFGIATARPFSAFRLPENLPHFDR